MKNIGKIILLVLGVVLIALGIKAFVDLPGQNAALEAAVYLDEPVVIPENEGKMVIIHGKPEMTAPAYDEELGLTLNTIKAYRYAEEYKLTSSEQLEYKYGWVSCIRRKPSTMCICSASPCVPGMTPPAM